jgi:hypothetical protein
VVTDTFNSRVTSRSANYHGAIPEVVSPPELTARARPVWAPLLEGKVGVGVDDEGDIKV